MQPGSARMGLVPGGFFAWRLNPAEDRARSGTSTQPQCWGGASFTPTCAMDYVHVPAMLPATPPRLSTWERICKRENSHERIIFPPYFSFSLKKNGQLSKKWKSHFCLYEQQADFRAVFKILPVSSSRALNLQLTTSWAV